MILLIIQALFAEWTFLFPVFHLFTIISCRAKGELNLELRVEYHRIKLNFSECDADADCTSFINGNFINFTEIVSRISVRFVKLSRKLYRRIGRILNTHAI